MEIKKIMAELTAAAMKADTSACTTETGATATLESLRYLGYTLTAGQKISAARFTKIAAQEAQKTAKQNPSRFSSSRFDRRLRGESGDDHQTRILTGRYDV